MIGRVLAITLLVASVARTQDFRITTISGEVWRATSVEIGSDGVVHARTTGGDTKETPLDEIESVDVVGRSGESNLAAAGPGRAWLRSGNDFGARMTGGGDGTVTLDLGFAPPATVAMVHLRALRLEAAEAAGDYDGFLRGLEQPAATDDLLFAWNRNTGKLSRLSVRVLGISEDGLRVDYRGERTVPLDQVHGIVFGRDNGITPPRPALPSIVVDVGGSRRLPGSLLGWSDGSVRLRMPEAIELTLPVEAVRRMDVRSSRVQRLSTIEPTEILQTPALDRVRPWLVDRAPGGDGLQLGDVEFRRGVCLFPYTRLTWAVDSSNGFDVFETIIGIDDRSTGPADAVFRVLVDGEVAFEREHVTRDVVERVRVPVRSARSIAIEVDFGENLDFGDHCVFAEPRLLKL